MDTSVKLVTDYILPDEPAWGLFEGPVMMPQPGRAIEDHWVQDIKVVRNDKIAHYIRDFGPAENYEHVTPLLMPSFGDDTVAQLQAWAEKNRYDNFWQKRREEMLAGSTLIADVLRQAEMDHEMINSRSVFGPAISVQRGVYPRQDVWRRWRDKRDMRKGKKEFYI